MRSASALARTALLNLLFFVSIQRLYTQDVSFHEIGHRVNEDSNTHSAFLYLR